MLVIIRTACDFFKDHMAHNKLSPKTIRYETEADGVTPLIHVINIPETDADIRQNLVGNTISAAVDAGLPIGQRGEVWILVAEAHLQLPDASIIGWTAVGSSAGSADDSGFAVLGSTLLTPLAQGARD